jgi:hypothetical protein
MNFCKRLLQTKIPVKLEFLLTAQKLGLLLLIRERTSAGRVAARRRGIHFGRPLVFLQSIYSLSVGIFLS